jgi:hypothetical protein
MRPARSGASSPPALPRRAGPSWIRKGWAAIASMVRRFADVPDGLTFRSLLHGGGWFEKLGGKAVSENTVLAETPRFELGLGVTPN